LRSTLIKWLAGVVTFLLPALIAAIGLHLDKSVYRNDPAYTAIIPVAAWSAIILAMVVPAALVLTTRMSLPRRLGLAAVIWCLLAIEFYMIFIAVLSSTH